jgi:hypothetical protein
MKEKMKEFFKHLYGYITDSNGDGDLLKVSGAIIIIIDVWRFATTGVFDPIAFGTGSATLAAGKALDGIIPKDK